MFDILGLIFILGTVMESECMFHDLAAASGRAVSRNGLDVSLPKAKLSLSEYV